MTGIRVRIVCTNSFGLPVMIVRVCNHYEGGDNSVLIDDRSKRSGPALGTSVVNSPSTSGASRDPPMPDAVLRHEGFGGESRHHCTFSPRSFLPGKERDDIRSPEEKFYLNYTDL
jgi:hypothetical protein